MSELTFATLWHIPRRERPPRCRVPVFGDWEWLVGCFAYTNRRAFGIVLAISVAFMCGVVLSDTRGVGPMVPIALVAFPLFGVVQYVSAPRRMEKYLRENGRVEG